MATIYDMTTGDTITDGLQGCDVCDEALMTAAKIADSRGRSVQLSDDDGDWEVFPAVNGVRQPAQFLGDTKPSRSAICGDFSLWQEYVDTHGVMSEAEFAEMPMSARLAAMTEAFGEG